MRYTGRCDTGPVPKFAGWSRTSQMPSRKNRKSSIQSTRMKQFNDALLADLAFCRIEWKCSNVGTSYVTHGLIPVSIASTSILERLILLGTDSGLAVHDGTSPLIIHVDLVPPGLNCSLDSGLLR